MMKIILSGIVLLLGGAVARAADGPYISPTMERVRLSFGVMKISNATHVRVDSTTGVLGTPVIAENDLDLDSSKVGPKFQAVVRVHERHRLRFDYFSLDRSAQKTLDKQIVFRNATYIVGDPVQSQLNLRSFGITYGYSFIHNQLFELAGTIGVNEIDLSARAKVQLPTRRIDQHLDQAGPIPTVGLDGVWAISKRFYLDGRFQYLKVNIDSFDGTLGFYEFSALYRWRANVSIGLGYNAVRTKLTSTKTAQSGFFDFNSKGPEIFMRIAF